MSKRARAKPPTQTRAKPPKNNKILQYASALIGGGFILLAVVLFKYGRYAASVAALLLGGISLGFAGHFAGFQIAPIWSQLCAVWSVFAHVGYYSFQFFRYHAS